MTLTMTSHLLPPACSGAAHHKLARSIRPCRKKKDCSAPRGSAFICKIGISTVFIRLYCHIWHITIKGNFGSLCEWIWKRLKSCLNLWMGLCYRLLCRFVSCHCQITCTPDTTRMARLVQNILTCQDGLKVCNFPISCWRLSRNICYREVTGKLV